MDTRELVCYAARLADEKKAENISVLDLRGKPSLCDFVLIATATSRPHLEAVEEEISKKLKEIGIYKINRDGGDSSQWRVSDYGGFLLHIITQEARDFYMLDEAFPFGKPVDFTKPVKKTTSVKKSTKKTTAKKTAAKKTTVKKTVSKKKVATKKTVAQKTAKPKKETAKKTTKKAVKK